MTITSLLHTLSILNPKANLHKTFSMQYIFNSLSHSLWESEATTLHILCSIHYEQGLKVVITLNWGTKLVKIKLVKNIYVSQNYSLNSATRAFLWYVWGGVNKFVVVWIWMAPIGSYVWTLDPKLVELPEGWGAVTFGEGSVIGDWLWGFTGLGSFPVWSVSCLPSDVASGTSHSAIMDPNSEI